MTSSADFVMPVPGTKVTVADTAKRSGVVPAFARTLDSAIEKHEAWAAAMSSSGLVRPSSSPVRTAHDTSSGPKAPLPTLSIVPRPVGRSPRQVTCACFSAAITPPPLGAAAT